MRALPVVWVVLAACSGAAEPTLVDGSAGPDVAPGIDATTCPAQPRLLDTHPHAREQATPHGRTLIDTEGWAGRLYFGYGDLEENTGPIWISSYDPTTRAWEDLLLFDTEQVSRFRAIGDRLWAPASDPRGSDPEYAVGTAGHAWSQASIGRSLHVLDVVERVPGDVYLVGSDSFDPITTGFGGAVWRSIDAGETWTRILPQVDTWDPTTWWFGNAGPFDGKVFTGSGGSTWVHDGMTWSKGVDLGGLIKPVAFAGVLVFEALGVLWSFDGTRPTYVGLELLQPAYPYYLGLFEVAEGHLVAVTAEGQVQATTDLVTWTCLGEAPADVASIGVLDGVIYFGGGEAQIYAYDQRSF